MLIIESFPINFRSNVLGFWESFHQLIFVKGVRLLVYGQLDDLLTVTLVGYYKLGPQHLARQE